MEPARTQSGPPGRLQSKLRASASAARPVTRLRMITEDVDARIKRIRSRDPRFAHLGRAPGAWHGGSAARTYGAFRASIWERGMGYSAILVHVDADADSDSRVRLALELAARCKAMLIGAGAWALQSAGAGDIAGGEDHGSDGADFVGGEEPDKPQIEEISAWLGRLGSHFRSNAGDKQVEWRSEVDFPSEFVVRQARAADLVIIGPDRTGDSYRSLDPGTVVIHAGRPVLLVPSAIDSLKGRRILIGWKD